MMTKEKAIQYFKDISLRANVRKSTVEDRMGCSFDPSIIEVNHYKVGRIRVGKLVGGAKIIVFTNANFRGDNITIPRAIDFEITLDEYEELKRYFFGEFHKQQN